MSEEATLDEFVQEVDENKQSQNWREVKLQEVAYKRSENVDPQEVELDKHVGLEHIEPNNPTPKWESLDDLSSTKRQFQSGDILFAKLRPNLEKSAQPDFDGVTSTDIFPIVAEQGINSKYLLYRLSSKPAFDYARRTSAGTRMPRTSWNLFSNFNFDLPPLPEQRKIATVLYTVDRAIEKAEEIVEQTRRIRNGIIGEILNLCGQSYKKPIEWGEIPEYWQEMKISEVCELVTDGTHMPPEQVEDGIPLLGVKDLEGGEIVFSDKDIGYISEEDYKEMSDSNKPERGDVLVGAIGTLGKSGIVRTQREFAIQRNLARLTPSESISTNYLYLVTQSSNFERQVKSRARRSVQSALYLEELNKIRIPVPPEKEQEETVDKVLYYDKYLEQYSQQKESLKRLKGGLMQDLLSGTVRTTDTNIEVPEEIAQYG